MTLQQAKYLMAIIRLGSITKASKEMYVAQSGLSSIIKEVEQEFGIQIFRRSNRGVELTLQGREFAEDLQHMLDQYDYIQEKYSHLAEEEVRLCVSAQHHVCGEEAFLKLVSGYQAKSFRFGYMKVNTERLLEDVEGGASDLGILFYYLDVKSILIQELRNRNLIFNHIAYQPPHIYVRRGHPLTDKTSVTTEELCDFPHISYDTTGTGASLYTATLRRANVSRQTFYMTDRATAYTILRRTDAYAVGAGFLSADDADMGIQCVPVKCDETLEVGWIYRDKQQISDVAQSFIALLKQFYC
jgi:DNA-binding transcriptional LysR family regulator